MKQALINTAVLLLLALSACAVIMDGSELERFPPGCRSTLIVEIQGFGEDLLEAKARKECAAECDGGTDEFKEDRCPELCGRPTPNSRDYFKPAEVCNLCSNGADIEISRCRYEVDSLVKRCKRGCKHNAVDPHDGVAWVFSSSGEVRLPFKSTITS